jgi:hypothetical protein
MVVQENLHTYLICSGVCKYDPIRLNFGVACAIPTRGILFLPVHLLVWAGLGTVARADSAASAELQGAPKSTNQSYCS